MNEIWKDIVGYEGLYQVSNLGNVKRINFFKKERFVIPCSNGSGYLYVSLSKNNKRKNFYIHRLVATAFIENHDNLPVINHKDENRSNNSVDNLEWCTQKYNCNYGLHK